MRIGVLGTGRIGLMHARNLAQTSGVDEVVLMGRDRTRLAGRVQQVEEALHPEAPPALAGHLAPRGRAAAISAGVGLTEELETLDGVVVATSTSTHPAFTLQLARAGVPSLVEKPLALDPEQLTALADELDGIGTEVMVAFHRRYDPGHQLLRQRILAGEAGTVRAVTATEHDHLALTPEYVPASGGIWLDMLIHDFDTIPWVTGQRVRKVWATGSVLDAPIHADYGDVDSAAAVLILESGAAATVSGLRRNGAGQDVRLEVFGTLDSFGAGIDACTPDELHRARDQLHRSALRPVHRPVRTGLPRRGRGFHPARRRDGRQSHPAPRRTRRHRDRPSGGRVDLHRLRRRPRPRLTNSSPAHRPERTR